MTQKSVIKANPEKIDLLENVMTQSQPCWLLKRSPDRANGVTEHVPKKKPIAAVLEQTYGEVNAKTVAKNVISPPVK